MASLNKVFLMGNLTRDPELRYTPNGSAVCEFGIAINRRFMQAGTEKDETCFLDIVVWGKQAESSSRFLQKGAGVFIEGRLVYEQWTEKDTQKKRSRIRINAERVQFLNRREDGTQGGEVYEEDSGADSGHEAAPRQASRQQSQGGGYRPHQRPAGNARPAAAKPQPAQGANAPQMPVEDPFEVVEGVDDDIPF